MPNVMTLPVPRATSPERGQQPIQLEVEGTRMPFATHLKSRMVSLLRPAIPRIEGLEMLWTLWGAHGLQLIAVVQ
jgi:hypothetical protein